MVRPTASPSKRITVCLLTRHLEYYVPSESSPRTVFLDSVFAVEPESFLRCIGVYVEICPRCFLTTGFSTMLISGS